MPELIGLQTPEFAFSVWAKDISQRTKVYRATLAKRASLAFGPTNTCAESSKPTAPSYKLYFAPGLAITDEQSTRLEPSVSPELMNGSTQAASSTVVIEPEKYSTLALSSPLFLNIPSINSNGYSLVR